MVAYRHKIMIYVTQKTLMASLWHGKQYLSHQTYQNQESGHTAFRQYLSQHKKATIEVVVDAVEEEYQLEVLPHVTASTRREMMRRKLSQFSRNSLYKTAYFLRKEMTARKEDVFVLLALSKPNFLQYWLEILQSEQALLAGVYALPMLSQLTLLKLKISPLQLLICERLSAGLRQTYLLEGRLRISRLTPIENNPSSQWSDFFVAEVATMHLYLRSQRLINDALPFEVMLSSSETEHPDVIKRLEQQGFSCKIIDRQGEFKKNHLNQTVAAMHPELHYLQLLNELGLKTNLAPTDMTMAYTQKQLRCKIDRVAALMTMISLFISGSLFLQGNHKNKRINELTKQTYSLQKKHALLMRHSPASLISGADMKSVVTTAQMISQQTPILMMQIISQALKDVPEVSISRLRWVQSDHENIRDEGEHALSEQAKQATGLDNTLLQIGLVSVKVNYFTADNQQALASANRLVSNLRADDRVKTAELVQRSVDTTLSAIQGKTSDVAETPPTPAVFKLKIILNQIEKDGDAIAD
jgi:hypothetical protein